MKQRVTYTISLPPDLARQVEEICKREGRTRSELFRQGLRAMIAQPDPDLSLLARIAALPAIKPRPHELRLIQKGRREAAHGESIPLSDYLRELDDRPREERPKKSRSPRRS